MRFLPKLRSRRLAPPTFLAVAYLLPPKIVEVGSYRDASKIADLPLKEASSIEVISTDPVRHGGVGLSRDRARVLVLSPDGGSISEWSITDKMVSAKPALTRRVDREQREALLELPQVSGPFSLKEDRLAFKPEREMPGSLWESALGFRPVALAGRPDGAIMGWGMHPAKLFFFGNDRKQLFRIDWPEGAEPIAFRPCDTRRAWLAENLRDGVVRLVAFEGVTARERGQFDFSGERRQSSLTGVAVASCEELFLAGSFGLVRVRFRR